LKPVLIRKKSGFQASNLESHGSEVFFMAEFKRKKGESFESFLRRFNKGLRNSKALNIARSKRTLVPKKSRREQKQYALKSLELRKQKNYLRKTGKLPEEETTYRR
jgi:hypothetical protein